MKRSSSGGRRMGGSGSRGISRGLSGGFRSTSSGYRGINRHHSYYPRRYGNSILPWWARLVLILFFLLMSTLLS